MEWEVASLMLNLDEFIVIKINTAKKKLRTSLGANHLEINHSILL